MSTLTPDNATDVSIKWSSSDTSVAVVNEKGKVTAVKTGEAVISATTTDGNKTAICKVTVSMKNDGIIKFVDVNAKEICVKYFDTDNDGELSVSEAAAVTEIPKTSKGSSVFSKYNAKYIIYFNEFQYFTSLKNLKETFYGQESLCEIILPESITSIDHNTFQDCKSLTNINIPNGVTYIGASAFKGCYSLTNINIPKGVTKIEVSTFSGCALTTFDIPDGVTNIGKWAFSNCSNLTNINIPATVTNIEYGAFMQCRSLTNINIPESVLSIDDSVFYRCYELSKVNISKGVVSIGVNAFSECRKLSSINIPNSVKSIGSDAFYGCKSLVSIVLPESVTKIGDSMFSDCDSLKSLTVLSEYPPTIGAGYLSSGLFFSDNKSITIFVPSALVERYKAHSQWRKYADRIQAIPE